MELIQGVVLSSTRCMSRQYTPEAIAAAAQRYNGRSEKLDLTRDGVRLGAIQRLEAVDGKLVGIIEVIKEPQ